MYFFISIMNKIILIANNYRRNIIIFWKPNLLNIEWQICTGIFEILISLFNWAINKIC